MIENVNHIKKIELNKTLNILRDKILSVVPMVLL